MDLGSNGMSSPMNEVFSKTYFFNVIACRPVDFPSAHCSPAGDASLHRFYSGIPRVANHGENFLHSRRRSLANKTGPGDVVINGAGCIFLGKNVEQDEVTFVDGRRAFRVRLVMRIAAMGVDANDGPVVSYEILALKRLHEPLLNLILVRPTVA